MARHEAQPEISRELGKRGHEVRKVDAAVQILAVGVDVLAEDGDVLIAGGNQPFDFFNDFLGPSRALTTAHIGDDAVRTEVVAAVHNGHPRLELRGPDNGDAFCDIARRIVDRENALASREDRLQQLREAPELVGVKHTVYMVVAVLDLFDHGGLAHHAATEKNFLRRVAVFGVDQRADISVDARFSVLTDGAGVDDDAVRALLGVRHPVAAFQQHAADALGIGLVLLAAVGIDKGERGPALGLPIACDFAADGRLPVELRLRDNGSVTFQKSTLR